MKRFSVHAAHEIQNWVIALQNSESSTIFLSKRYLCTHRIRLTPSGSECILFTFPSGLPSVRKLQQKTSKHNHIRTVKNASILNQAKTNLKGRGGTPLASSQ